MENYSENNTEPTENSIFPEEHYENHSEPSSTPSLNFFANFARSLGIFSIFCAVCTVSMGSFICGGLAIVFAIISKGYETKMEKSARVGIATGILAITLQIAVFSFNIYSFIFVPEYREQFYSIYEEMYGEPIDESVNELLNEMGLPELKGDNL